MAHWGLVISTSYKVFFIFRAIRRRRLKARTWDNMKFDDIIHGVPKPVTASHLTGTQEGSKQVKATPGGHGRYTGPCKVIKAFSEVSRLQPGDILVTVSTDIGWSPVFPLLGGVVTELGGLISHGAVVAREYGLPCVVSAKGATSMFKDGEVLEIDGTEGTVKCMEEN